MILQKGRDSPSGLVRNIIIYISTISMQLWLALQALDLCLLVVDDADEVEDCLRVDAVVASLLLPFVAWLLFGRRLLYGFHVGFSFYWAGCTLNESSNIWLGYWLGDLLTVDDLALQLLEPSFDVGDSLLYGRYPLNPFLWLGSFDWGFLFVLWQLPPFGGQNIVRVGLSNLVSLFSGSFGPWADLLLRWLHSNTTISNIIAGWNKAS